ncbi:protein kinase domain-containing protein [Haliangium sp.]
MAQSDEETALASHMRPRGQPGANAEDRAGVLMPSERYLALRLLGSGGFGEVWRVRDRKLDRVVAMKVVRPDVEQVPRLRARFLSEIKLTADLQHPGIVAVHDFGELADGRLWFTMREVRGRTLYDVIDDAFAANAPDTTSPRDRRRRLVDVFARVCETIAFAHSRGVIHRDLKPANIMVGEFGEVVVMDWGIARRIGTAPDDGDPVGDGEPVAEHGPIAAGEPVAQRDAVEEVDAVGPVDNTGETGETGETWSRVSETALTRHGDVLGTPAYMAPEQARGEVARHGPAADVYALGAILFHLLTGRPSYLVQRLRAAARPPTPTEAAPPGMDIPDELAAICMRAMAPEPEQRYPDAGALAAVVTSWLDGARRRERALAELERIMPASRSIAAFAARAAECRSQARKRLAEVQPRDPVEVKAMGWALEDEAEALEREAALEEARWLQGVHGALAIEPELPEAHAALADHYRDRLLEAERARHYADAARFEVLLRAHDRGRHAAILAGHGALTLVTDPEGARVTLYRYTRRQRRLVPELVGELGHTPLREVALDRGSYLVRIEAPGRAEVLYPVLIERGEHWHGCPPGATEPTPVPLPPAAEISTDEVYVPPGWTWIGGDPDATDSLPRRRLWIDGFFIGRRPVTNAEYVAFLNDLVDTGREAEALDACPRAHQGMVPNAQELLCYPRDPRGHFALQREVAGEVWLPQAPAVLMNWHGAGVYARWRGARAGRPYRLPNELEREKAVRGADGRLFPWGNHFDPTWACMARSHGETVERADVDAFPADVSPYGLRGGAGNSRDWCINRWTPEGPATRGDRLCIDPAPATGDDYRTVRGGAWNSEENGCRAAARFANRPGQHRYVIGLRVARSYP